MTSVIDFVLAHKTWAAPLLGLAALLESVAIVGAFVPSTTLMVVAGGLMAAGLLDPLPTLAFGFLGAVVGDAGFYWLGRRIGSKALRAPKLVRFRRLLARTRGMTRRHGAASLVLVRFVGPVRPFLPLMAGMMGMAGPRFHLANLLGGAVWVLAAASVGAVGAHGLTHLSDPRLWAFLGALALAAAAAIAARAVLRRGLRRASPFDYPGDPRPCTPTKLTNRPRRNPPGWSSPAPWRVAAKG